MMNDSLRVARSGPQGMFLLALASASLVLTSCSGLDDDEANDRASRQALPGSVAGSAPQMPAGLRPAWTRARRADGSPAYVSEVKAATFTAHHAPANPGSPPRGGAFGATLDNRGVALEIGEHRARLSLAAIGRNGALEAVHQAQPEGGKNGVRYRHGSVVERWVHDPRGLEQLFDLDERPAGTGNLVVQLDIGGGLAPRLEPGGEQIALVSRDGAARLYYGELSVVDAQGARVPAKLGVSEGHIELSLDDRGATYPLHIDPLLWAEQAKLIASNGEAHDGLGRAVSLSGDTALVGATGIHDGAYVFVRSGTAWTQQQELTASDWKQNDELGYAVSLSGDTALVGSMMHTVGGNVLVPAQGSAYVFVRSDTAWTQQQELMASDAAAFDRFGSAVSLSGDTALVGANTMYAAGGKPGHGSAYVFVRSGTTWAQQAKLTASDGAANDQFGRTASLSGDTALVGALDDDVGGNVDQGSAYVFVRSGTTWAQQAKLTASDGEAHDRFGTNVTIDGDTALVGAGGSAYVFVRSGTTWAQQAKLTASDGTSNNGFGSAVSLLGDTALIGEATDTAVGKVYQGSAYLFARSGITWTQQHKLIPSDGNGDERFGRAVSLSGDTALIGATGATVGGKAVQGAAYVFQAGAAGGAAGTGGASSGSAGTGGSPTPPGSTDSGCGCHLSGSPARPQRLAWLFGLAAFIRLRRRARADARG